MADQKRKLAFWDIESLANIFMFAIYMPKTEQTTLPTGETKDIDWLLFFYLFDDMTLTGDMRDAIKKKVFELNPQIKEDTTKIQFMNLNEPDVNIMLVDLFCVDNKPVFADASANQFAALTKKLHSDLDDDVRFPYMIGYNSSNYDLTMMAHYFNETWRFTKKPAFLPVTAKEMRIFNNILFDSYKENMPDALQDVESAIYQNILSSGLYLDAARINDKVYKMALKRIMGMLGMDIFEDDLVKNGGVVVDKDDICKLFAYNASDVIKLSKLMEHKAYKAQFQLKQGLLQSYPDIIYNQNGNVRVNRLKIDSTSANFAARVLCPDGYLHDIPTVSYEYPKGSGRNILKETWDWAKDKLKNAPEALEQLEEVFKYYASLEGKNFDNSDHYTEVYGYSYPAVSLKDFATPKSCVPYFNADGSITSTYVNFSVGGIHGAEFNKELYEQDLKEYNQKFHEIDSVVSCYTTQELKDLKTTFEHNGQKLKKSNYVTVRKATGDVVIKYPKTVELFTKTPSGNWQLNKKYVYVSDDETDHQDFTSYYPGLLMKMKAFENPSLGSDRYVEQFNNKTEYGKLMKDSTKTQEERDFYSTLREGTKLILNSASGAADTTYNTNIRMNNVIISMRIIGQLFTWRIGQAETFEGFKITSTNTDGLYAACNEKTRPRLREILEREAATIGVPIEPEEMRLVTKDANNRIEVSLDGKLLSASGGDVACWKGPTPTKALSHPAIIDTLMVKYLIKYGVNEVFDEMKAMEILDSIKNEMSPLDLLILYQHIINSSEASVRYIFAQIDNDVKTLQHNNRIFAVKANAAKLYLANAWDKGDGSHDAIADKVLTQYGVKVANYKTSRIMKISRIPSTQNFFIYNKALDELSEVEQKAIIANIDDGFYINMLRNTYHNWCNVPYEIVADDE